MSSKINLIKQSNLNKVRSALKEAGTATKPQLAELTGLSVVTINSLVSTLLDSGEFLPDKILDSEGGRPAASFRYNSWFRMALVIYMHEYRGQDTAFFCVVDLQGNVIERLEQPLSDVVLESFDPEIERLLEHYPQIQVICFGIPGYEVNKRLVISDYENLREQSLSGHVEEKFHLPVLVENDINLAVMGYCSRNGIENDKCVIGIYFPDKYPPGAGIYFNGRILRGKDGLAGEIKYLPFDVDWDRFDYDPERLEEIMLKTIQAFQCIFNPDTIVVYRETISSKASQLVMDRSVSGIEKLMLPEILVSTDLNKDFEAGIKQLAVDLIRLETTQD
jgi:hypothetical protein